MLKKQTVWLLTMLSLVVVLSVYYIMSPESKNAVQMKSEKSASDSGEVATEKAPAKQDTKEKSGTESETEKEDGTKGTKDSSADKETSAEASEKGTVVTETADDDLFTTYRLDLEDARSKEREELNAIVSSDDATAKEKSEAYDKMTALSEVEGTEKQLETLIKTQGYEDALVNAEGDKINITVKADKHSKSKATAIIDLVAKEIKTMKDVAVTFEPSK
ncbi:stage III sporulation ratchet engulfment protein SpoIIIAH [Bacillus cabrialesii]|uniref:Stage III sporulation ratchet engulfment protein SpoIIIAH n=1 Tax=Bacillus cabrialesii subsp. tritici TaxID=2944916 RepID=A0ABT9DLT1_9BACI|nr:stage III sporulation ratchet engulfment protein SpoIIIAH [Bacillus cabrialesii]KJJ40657.1 stage III sporulation protein AH [Bacillus subtilis]OLQ56244.1 stage III sporulation protein AH [Bacillus licheniformis]MBU2658127.1 stage III sporulation ratchet engulfment protein SpoIIIAH [Bacillus cabrialesii]MDO8225666.1 stage III sporulation ratchet engulfment protein SpoIIIAH [Bacillus cabrialesii subsp. tritici]MDU0154266.1 stage III sporulation ratchet engulfment protein SpoIIIAH [Bacillus ca